MIVGARRHAITVRLVGTTSNRAGMGARISVIVRSGCRNELRAREVTSGGSFGSNSLAQHIGLGTATIIERLEVTWPASNTTQTLSGCRWTAPSR